MNKLEVVHILFSSLKASSCQVLWCNSVCLSSVLVSNSACSTVKKCFKELSILVTLEILFFSKLSSIFAKTTDALSPVIWMKCWIFATISLTLKKNFACAMERWFRHWFLCFCSSSSIPPGKHLALLDASKWCVPNHSFHTEVLRAAIGWSRQQTRRARSHCDQMNESI